MGFQGQPSVYASHTEATRVRGKNLPDGGVCMHGLRSGDCERRIVQTRERGVVSVRHAVRHRIDGRLYMNYYENGNWRCLGDVIMARRQSDKVVVRSTFFLLPDIEECLQTP